MKLFGCLCSLLLLLSCSKGNDNKKAAAIARVNNEYLYPSDLENLVPAGTPKKDSIAIVKDFINRWATQQLLMNNAKYRVFSLKYNTFLDIAISYRVV